MSVTYYASGTNHPGEIAGFACVPGAAIGTVVSRCDPQRSPETFAAVADFPGRVFVDSGAFSEVDERPDGSPVVARPMSDDAWRRIDATYDALSKALGDRLAVVAPDVVGDQAASYLRFLQWTAAARLVVWRGGEALIPLQAGPTSRFDYFIRCGRAILRGDPRPHKSVDRIVPAFPMKKDATPLEEIRAFLLEAQPARVHFLGLGLDGKRFEKVRALVKEVSPHTAISCDSCLIRRFVGKRNGAGGGPRALTAVHDELANASVFDRKKLAVARVFASYWTERGADDEKSTDVVSDSARGVLRGMRPRARAPRGGAMRRARRARGHLPVSRVRAARAPHVVSDCEAARDPRQGDCDRDPGARVGQRLRARQRSRARLARSRRCDRGDFVGVDYLTRFFEHLKTAPPAFRESFVKRSP